ncbi:MAG: hypothetical protein DNFNHJIP_00520 [Candidatus Argoarchaeum ethanivorans]|uniref:Uncharacterized protein n=1 Tax=Candidatus Argoarchaeum ethanivorans TaxID=2608793 RepID=A0A812A399_9EURY|nr:MAG: hypothetical protein DNFNHJIP_00520 [Candidatus Argoarchaeum ethanivorans]
MTSEFDTCVELSDKIREGILIELSKKYREKGEIVVGSTRMFMKAIELIGSAKKRLFLIMRTPPYLISPPPHDSSDIQSEKVIEKWVKEKIEEWSLDVTNRTLIVPEAQFFYVLPSLVNKIKEHPGSLETFEKNIEKFKNIEIKSEGRFKITSITKSISPLVIADENICYYSPIYGREGFGINVRDNNLAEGLIKYIESSYVNYFKTKEDLNEEIISSLND